MRRLIERAGDRKAASRRQARRAGVAREDFMAMMKAGLAGAAIGALALATVMFVAPIAAQGPGAPPPSGPDGFRGPGGPPPDGPGMRGPGMMGPGPMGRGRDMGPGMMGGTPPGMMGRRGVDPNDPDITGPRGDAELCQDRLTRVAQWRLERIARLVRPTDDQRAAFEELKAASAKAVEIMRAACPTERMAMAEKWLEARLQAVKTVRPALESFYKLLSDEQKIRWSTGSMLGHRFGHDGRWQGRGDREDRWRDEHRRDEERGGWGGPGRNQDQWHERWRDWHERFGEDRGRGGERRGDRWGEPEGNRWRQDRWRERGWHDERGRADERNEERL